MDTALFAVLAMAGSEPWLRAPTSVIWFPGQNTLMLAFTDTDHWTPGIGDPTIVGWITVAAYFLTACWCWRAAALIRGENPAPPAIRLRWFWRAFCLLLFLLGVNKQLDLQTWLTFFFRHLAVAEGWYEKRRAAQEVFILSVAIGGIGCLFGMFLLAGRMTRSVVTALVGGVLLGCFVMVRASSFHHVDRLLHLDLGGLKMNWILELGSIAVIAAGARMAVSQASVSAPAKMRGVSCS